MSLSQFIPRYFISNNCAILFLAPVLCPPASSASPHLPTPPTHFIQLSHRSLVFLSHHSLPIRLHKRQACCPIWVEKAGVVDGPGPMPCGCGFTCSPPPAPRPRAPRDGNSFVGSKRCPGVAQRLSIMPCARRSPV